MTNKVKLKYDYIMKLEYDGEVKDGLPHGQGTFNIYGELLFKELIEKLRKKESKEDEYEHLFHHTCTTQYLQALIEVSLKDSKPKDFDQDVLEVSGHRDQVTDKAIDESLSTAKEEWVNDYFPFSTL